VGSVSVFGVVALGSAAWIIGILSLSCDCFVLLAAVERAERNWSWLWIRAGSIEGHGKPSSWEAKGQTPCGCKSRNERTAVVFVC